MHGLHLIHRQSDHPNHDNAPKVDSFEYEAQIRENSDVYDFAIRTNSNPNDDNRHPFRTSEGPFRPFLTARGNLWPIAENSSYPYGKVLIRQGEKSSGEVLYLVGGRVTSSIRLADGRRLIVGIAMPGDILGLSSVISGLPSGITLETQYSCLITSFRREAFLAFLRGNPGACTNVATQLSRDCIVTYEQIPAIGPAHSAPARLALFLMNLCEMREHPGCGVRVYFSLTHAEIGEHLGESGETIAQRLTDFNSMRLLEIHPTNLVILNPGALANFARTTLNSVPLGFGVKSANYSEPAAREATTSINAEPISSKS